MKEYIKEYIIFMFIILGIIFLSVVVTALSARQEVIDKTFTACQHSRIDNTISEDQCARMQDDNHLEYLCKERNNLSTNHCWVEEK